MEDDLMGTLNWQRLRMILLDALQDNEILRKNNLAPEDVTKLLAFLSEQWGLQAPRQAEIAASDQAHARQLKALMHRLEHEIQKREDVAETMQYQRPLIEEVE